MSIEMFKITNGFKEMYLKISIKLYQIQLKFKTLSQK